jgi:uncharacterized protein (TIGR03083 family)
MTPTAPPLTLAVAHASGLELVRRHTARFAAFVAALSDEDVTRPVPGSAWTVAETVAHVSTVYLRYTVDLRRAASPAEVAAHNAEDLARVGTEVSAALASMAAQVERMPGAINLFAPDQPLPFHAGQTITLAGGWGNLLGELLAHGDDIARATGGSFTIPSADLEVLWRFTTPALQGWLHPDTAGLHERWRLMLEFGALDLLIDDGRLHVTDAGVDPPDHLVVAPDAAELALTVPYGRRPAADPEVTLLASRFQPL